MLANSNSEVKEMEYSVYMQTLVKRKRENTFKTVLLILWHVVCSHSLIRLSLRKSITQK